MQQEGGDSFQKDLTAQDPQERAAREKGPGEEPRPRRISAPDQHQAPESPYATLESHPDTPIHFASSTDFPSVSLGDVSNEIRDARLTGKQPDLKNQRLNFEFTVSCEYGDRDDTKINKRRRRSSRPADRCRRPSSTDLVHCRSAETSIERDVRNRHKRHDRRPPSISRRVSQGTSPIPSSQPSIDVDRNELGSTGGVICEIGEHVASLRTIFWLYLQKKVKFRLANQGRRRQLLLAAKRLSVRDSSVSPIQSISSLPTIMEEKGNDLPREASPSSTTSFKLRRAQNHDKEVRRERRSEAFLTASFVIFLGVTTYVLQHGSSLPTPWILARFGRHQQVPAPKERISFLAAPIPAIKEYALNFAGNAATFVKEISKRLNATEAWSRSTWETNKKQFDSPAGEKKQPTKTQAKAKPPDPAGDGSTADLLSQTSKPSKTRPDSRKRWPRYPFQKPVDEGSRKRPAAPIRLSRYEKEDEFEDDEFDDDERMGRAGGKAGNWLLGTGITDLVDTLNTMPYAPTDLFKNPAMDWMKFLWKYLLNWVGFSYHFLFGMDI